MDKRTAICLLPGSPAPVRNKSLSKGKDVIRKGLLNKQECRRLLKVGGLFSKWSYRVLDSALSGKGEEERERIQVYHPPSDG